MCLQVTWLLMTITVRLHDDHVTHSENSPLVTQGLCLSSLPLSPSLFLCLPLSILPYKRGGECWWSWPSRHKTFSSYWRKWDRPLFTGEILYPFIISPNAEPSCPIPSVLFSFSSHNKPCVSGHDISTCSVLLDLYSCDMDSSHCVL